MHGGLRHKDLILPVHSGTVIPRMLTIRQNGEPLSFDLPISEWRIMRQEKIDSYWKRYVEEYIGLRFGQFLERQTWFKVPHDKTMIVGVYYDKKIDSFVGGLVTQPAAGAVIEHGLTRMPYFGKKWWDEEPSHWAEVDRVMEPLSSLIHTPSARISPRTSTAPDKLPISVRA